MATNVTMQSEDDRVRGLKQIRVAVKDKASMLKDKASSTIKDSISTGVHWIKKHINPEEDIALDELEIARKELPLKMRDISTRLKPYSRLDGPQIYKLPLRALRRDDNEMVAKYYVDKSTPTYTTGVPERVLILVGAIGAGKSTLINSMANYILGVNWSHDFRFRLITTDYGSTQGHSQTKYIMAYTFPYRRGSPVHYNLTIIDTPGFGDVGGIKQDKKIMAHIRKLFERSCQDGGIDTIHGIGFVATAPESTLTPTQKFIFNAILHNFGVDIGGNISLMVTFADRRKPPILDAVERAELPITPTMFKFNSSALYAPNAEHSDEDSDFNSLFWKTDMKSFRDFFRNFREAEAWSMQLSGELLREREQLENLAQNLYHYQLQLKMNKLSILCTEREILHQNKELVMANKDFKFEAEEESVAKVDIENETHCVTNCQVCNHTCHVDCSIPNNDRKMWCSAMSNGFCVICPGKCYWDRHTHDSFYYEPRRTVVKRTYKSMQMKYIVSSKDSQGKAMPSELVFAGIDREISELRQEVFAMIVQLQQTLERLEELTNKPNPMTLVNYIDCLVHLETKQSRNDKERRIRFYQEVRQQAVLMATAQDKKSLTDSQLDSYLDTWSVNLLISAEKKHKKEGWDMRVKYFERMGKRMSRDCALVHPQNPTSTDPLT